VIAATDAVLLKSVGCDDAFVAHFLDVPQENSRHALEMACQLALIENDPAVGYRPRRPFATYVVTAREVQKAAVLRLVLEDYEPYRVFKSRLEIVGLAPQAAEQVKQLYNMARHRDEIKDTLVNLGTYAQSLVSEGAGLFRVATTDTRQASFLDVVAAVAADRATAETAVRRKLGGDAAVWIDQADVFAPLVTAYQHLFPGTEPRSTVLYAGNAVEAFLVQLAAHHHVNLAGASGINSKVDRIATAGRLTTKQKAVLKYLGHIRNAADHGNDQEIGGPWDISPETATEYVHVAFGATRSVVARLSGRHIL
jgi:hypothetical protein